MSKQFHNKKCHFNECWKLYITIILLYQYVLRQIINKTQFVLEALGIQQRNNLNNNNIK